VNKVTLMAEATPKQDQLQARPTNLWVFHGRLQSYTLSGWRNVQSPDMRCTLGWCWGREHWSRIPRDRTISVTMEIQLLAQTVARTLYKLSNTYSTLTCTCIEKKHTSWGLSGQLWKAKRALLLYGIMAAISGNLAFIPKYKIESQ